MQTRWSWCLPSLSSKTALPDSKWLRRQDAGLLELHQHPVDRGQSDIRTFGEQHLVDVFGAHVPLRGLLEHLQDLDARQRGLEAAALEFVGLAHGRRMGPGWELVGLSCAAGPGFAHDVPRIQGTRIAHHIELGAHSGAPRAHHVPVIVIPPAHAGHGRFTGRLPVPSFDPHPWTGTPTRSSVSSRPTRSRSSRATSSPANRPKPSSQA